MLKLHIGHDGSVGGGAAVGSRGSCISTTGGSASGGGAAGWIAVDHGSGGEAGSVADGVSVPDHECNVRE